VDAYRSIDVNRLHKAGCLRADWFGGWEWSREGEKVASINLRAETDQLHLSYRVSIGSRSRPLVWRDAAVFCLPGYHQRYDLQSTRGQASVEPSE
jgi:hypothetical protein